MTKSEPDILGLLKRARGLLAYDCPKAAKDNLDAAIERLERATIVEGWSFQTTDGHKFYEGEKAEAFDNPAALIVLEADDE